MRLRVLSFASAVMLFLCCYGAGGDSYTIVVSLDGFRWDYPEAYDTPFFDRLAQEGVKAVMMPSFPTKTFPNHYTLATGLYPDHHGIIGNKFKNRATGKVYAIANRAARTDPSYYGGEPLWLTAKRQGVKSATIYWVGSDAPIQGQQADYWKDYNKGLLTMPQRVDEIIRLLSLPEQDRPHLVMAYFEEPDGSGHTYGPISAQTRRTLEQQDSLMSTLWSRLQQLPIAHDINLIITGDHGMTWIHPERQVRPKDYLKDEWVDAMYNDPPMLIYAAKPQYADSIYLALKDVEHLRVWRRGEVPSYLNYGNNVNMGDVIVLPDVGWLFENKPQAIGGTHGYDHTASDMWVAFRAIGPDFKQGYNKTGTFQNVCVYSLVCHLLGITPAPNDGTLEQVADMLK